MEAINEQHVSEHVKETVKEEFMDYKLCTISLLRKYCCIAPLFWELKCACVLVLRFF